MLGILLSAIISFSFAAPKKEYVPFQIILEAKNTQNLPESILETFLDRKMAEDSGTCKGALVPKGIGKWTCRIIKEKYLCFKKYQCSWSNAKWNRRTVVAQLKEKTDFVRADFRPQINISGIVLPETKVVKDQIKLGQAR